MQIKRIFLLIVIAITLNSCINTIDGNGEVVKENRNIESFNKIDISGGFEIIMNQGNEERLELEVDENLLELIETEVKNNTLYISSLEPIGNASSLKLYITIANIEDIDASGAIELKNKGFEGEDIGKELRKERSPLVRLGYYSVLVESIKENSSLFNSYSQALANESDNYVKEAILSSIHYKNTQVSIQTLKEWFLK